MCTALEAFLTSSACPAQCSHPTMKFMGWSLNVCSASDESGMRLAAGSAAQGMGLLVAVGDLLRGNDGAGLQRWRTADLPL